MIERRSQLDKIIITAMDRFVWFVLLVVMSHLVTEFTRVSGYARGQRQELMLVNDTLLQPMPVQNMLLYPGNEYVNYGSPSGQYGPPSNGGNSFQQNAAMLLGSLGGGGGVAAGNSVASANNNAEPGYPLFSFRPLIDSIFEIPISTLRAVNNLVARLTGSYRQAPETDLKSAALTDAQLRLPQGASNGGASDFKLATPAARKAVLAMREERA